MHDTISLAELNSALNPTNVVKAAEFILNLDHSALSDYHLPAIQSAVLYLQNSLEDFRNPKPLSYLHKFSAIHHLENDLIQLLTATRAMLPHLTQTAQEELQIFLCDPFPLREAANTDKTLALKMR